MDKLEFNKLDHHGASHRTGFLIDVIKLSEHIIGKNIEKMTVLDCGTGKGHLVLKELEKDGVNVYGVTLDDSEEHCRVQVCDMSNTPYVDKMFDLVWSSHSIEHVSDVFSVFKEWERIIKDDGYLVILCPYHGDYELYTPTHMLVPTIEQLLNFGKKTSFLPVRAFVSTFMMSDVEFKKNLLVIFKKTIIQSESNSDYLCFNCFFHPAIGMLEEIGIQGYSNRSLITKAKIKVEEKE